MGAQIRPFGGGNWMQGHLLAAQLLAQAGERTGEGYAALGAGVGRGLAAVGVGLHAKTERQREDAKDAQRLSLLLSERQYQRDTDQRDFAFKMSEAARNRADELSGLLEAQTAAGSIDPHLQTEYEKARQDAQEWAVTTQTVHARLGSQAPPGGGDCTTGSCRAPRAPVGAPSGGTKIARPDTSPVERVQAAPPRGGGQAAPQPAADSLESGVQEVARLSQQAEILEGKVRRAKTLREANAWGDLAVKARQDEALAKHRVTTLAERREVEAKERQSRAGLEAHFALLESQGTALPERERVAARAALASGISLEKVMQTVGRTPKEAESDPAPQLEAHFKALEANGQTLTETQKQAARSLLATGRDLDKVVSTLPSASEARATPMQKARESVETERAKEELTGESRLKGDADLLDRFVKEKDRTFINGAMGRQPAPFDPGRFTQAEARRLLAMQDRLGGAHAANLEALARKHTYLYQGSPQAREAEARLLAEQEFDALPPEEQTIEKGRAIVAKWRARLDEITRAPGEGG